MSIERIPQQMQPTSYNQYLLENTTFYDDAVLIFDTLSGCARIILDKLGMEAEEIAEPLRAVSQFIFHL